MTRLVTLAARLRRRMGWIALFMVRWMDGKYPTCCLPRTTRVRGGTKFRRRSEALTLTGPPELLHHTRSQQPPNPANDLTNFVFAKQSFVCVVKRTEWDMLGVLAKPYNPCPSPTRTFATLHTFSRINPNELVSFCLVRSTRVD